MLNLSWHTSYFLTVFSHPTRIIDQIRSVIDYLQIIDPNYYVLVLYDEVFDNPYTIQLSTYIPNASNSALFGYIQSENRVFDKQPCLQFHRAGKH